MSSIDSLKGSLAALAALASGMPASVAARAGGRYPVYSNFSKRPATTAEIDPSGFGTQAAIRAYSAAEKDWLLSGTNASSGSASFHTKGGVTLTTAGASGDQCILSPLIINSVEQTSIGGTQWTPERAPMLELVFRTGASVADLRLMLGLKLTAVEEDHDSGATITDDDYALAVFDTTHAASATVLHACTGNTGTDENTAGNSAVPGIALQADTRHLLGIAFDGDQRPHYTIDGQEFAVGQRMRTGLALRPIFGIRALAASAKSVTLQTLGLSQNL